MNRSIRNQPNSAVTLSILDRLVDDESREDKPMREREKSVRALRAGVRRDLEWLLNTRRIADPDGITPPETENSVYTYGLPDFSTYAIASAKEQTRLIRGLQTAVKLFEPRLTNVKISALEVNPKGLRTMRIRIEGFLMMDPAPEHISFDTMLQLTTGDFSVKDDPNA
jgi:type VI secretion system protein ImpF